HLDLHRDRRLDADRVTLAHDPGPARDPRPEPAHHRHDRGRIHVHAAHDEHVVAAPETAHPEAGPPAVAGGALDADYVAADEADDGHRLPGQVRVGELAHRARLDRHRLPAVGVHQLGPDVAGAAEVHALLER